MEQHNKLIVTELNNYKAVDIMKYVAAIMVICIHCNPILFQLYLNYFVKQILCRIAVPFFFISSAYFIRKGSFNKPHYLKNYLNKLVKSYLAWSIIFIPIGLDWIYQNLTLSQNLLPFALIFGLIHVGTYYHLWYIPATICSLFIVDKLLKHVRYTIVFLISVLFFLFGSLETYYGLLTNGWLKEFFDFVIQIFFTTRSGLLYGMIFVVIGFFIYDYKEKLKPLIKYVPMLTLLSSVLMIIEGISLYDSPKLDMNFLISLIPFGFFFFLWILSFPIKIACDTTKMRTLSKYYYFVHIICIVIVEEFGKSFQINILYSGILSFLLILLLTHILCLVIIAILKQPLRSTLVILAALLGMVMTFIIASLLYQFKSANIVIKFELVPCLWVFTSIIVYFLLHQRKNEWSDVGIASSIKTV